MLFLDAGQFAGACRRTISLISPMVAAMSDSRNCQRGVASQLRRFTCCTTATNNRDFHQPRQSTRQGIPHQSGPCSPLAMLLVQGSMSRRCISPPYNSCCTPRRQPAIARSRTVAFEDRRSRCALHECSGLHTIDDCVTME
jgi:hypothetical protein